MISEHNKFRLGTPEAGVSLEVNWTDSEEVRDCKRIRVHIPKSKEDKSFVIKKEELNAILFVLGNKEEQMKMIPQVESRSRWYETVVTVKNKSGKPIPPGGDITFPITLTLPTFEEEIISEAKKDVLKSTLPIIGS